MEKTPAPFSFLERIFQAGGGSVIKHAGVAIDAKCSATHWHNRNVRFLNLSGRQGNAFQPDRFVPGPEQKTLGDLILALQAGFAHEGGVVGRGGAPSHLLGDHADSGRLLRVVVVNPGLHQPVNREAAALPNFPIRTDLETIEIVDRRGIPERRFPGDGRRDKAPTSFSPRFTQRNPASMVTRQEGFQRS